MNNPFLFGPGPKSVKDVQATNDDQMMVEAGRVAERHALALRLGRLLIRMGTKLTHEEARQYKSERLVS